MEVFVIGAGASGLVSAIKARDAGCNVTILERNNKCGKKILLTGNGRCNFYNENQDIKHYHSSNIELFKEILESKKDEILPFFKDLGIVYKNNNGYYYPYSNQSTSIVNALFNKVKKLKIEIIKDTLVTKIEKKDKFIIYSDNNKFYADKVILACGSSSYPKTGSDGNGYILVRNLGHKINKVLPSLVQLVGEESFYKEWKGIRCDAKLTLFENDKKIKEERGELQLTDYGISGICTFNLSALVSRGLNKNKKEVIEINFIPWFDKGKKEFLTWMNDQNNKLSNYKLKDILEGFLNYKLVSFLLKLSNIKEDATWNEVDKEKLIDLIMSFKFKVKETKSFENSQTCIGGVPLEEINTKTMESKIIKGLYLTGELLDVDGDCGGYNLSFAWMSGMLAGESVRKND